jgi:hypothetical protein
MDPAAVMMIIIVDNDAGNDPGEEASDCGNCLIARMGLGSGQSEGDYGNENIADVCFHCSGFR